MSYRVVSSRAVTVAVFAVLFSIFLFVVVVVKGEENIYPIVWCNRETVDEENVYVTAINKVRIALSETNPEDLRRINGRYFQASNGGVRCYGHGSCKNSLENGDCGRCMVQATEMTLEKCGYSIGVQVELPSCKIRYEPYNFTE